MTIETYNPSNTNTAPTAAAISFTEVARDKAEQAIADQQAAGLRLTVKASGCSGFRYNLDIVSEAPFDDIKLDISDKLTLFVPEACIQLLNGTEIDFVTKGLNSSFEFNNPNSTGECGCGESFTVS